MHAQLIGAQLPLPTCVDRARMELSEAGLLNVDKRIVTCRDEQDDCESCAMITLLVLPNLKVPVHSIIFSRRPAILIIFSFVFRLRLSIL